LNADDSLEELLNSDRYREFLQTVSNFHTYSWRNVLLIFKQMPNATKIASYDVWKNNHNRTIIRDSKGIRILSPVPTEPKKTLVEKVDPSTGIPVLDGEGKKIYEESFLPSSPKFKEISVFDITQTRGSPVLKLIDGISDNEAFFGAFFDSLKIVFAPSGVSDCTAQTIENLVNAKTFDIFGKHPTLPQVGEKLARESIAYVICWRFGIDAAEMSFDYISEKVTEISPFFCEIIGIIKDGANKIITSLEENFIRLCEERGVNPMIEYSPEAKNAEIKPSAPMSAKSISQIEPLQPPA
jgi:hypothetical protein